MNVNPTALLEEVLSMYDQKPVDPASIPEEEWNKMAGVAVDAYAHLQADLAAHPDFPKLCKIINKTTFTGNEDPTVYGIYLTVFDTKATALQAKICADLGVKKLAVPRSLYNSSYICRASLRKRAIRKWGSK